jgi:DNA-directed RNA polymerase specialized sigma24 family protein
VKPLSEDAELDQLLARSKRGDRRAQTILLESFRQYLRAIAKRNISDNLTAKISPRDVVQETMFKAHRQFGSIRSSTSGQLKKWLAQILNRQLSDMRRHYEQSQCRTLQREQS